MDAQGEQDMGEDATDYVDVMVCEREECGHPLDRHWWPLGCDLCTCPCPVEP
jgi:hypothetical protein